MLRNISDICYQNGSCTLKFLLFVYFVLHLYLFEELVASNMDKNAVSIRFICIAITQFKINDWIKYSDIYVATYVVTMERSLHTTKMNVNTCNTFLICANVHFYNNTLTISIKIANTEIHNLIVRNFWLKRFGRQTLSRKKCFLQCTSWSTKYHQTTGQGNVNLMKLSYILTH